MNLEVTKELVDKIKNNEIDFSSFYEDKDIKMWEAEIKELFSMGATSRLEDLLGFALYYIAMYFNQKEENYKEYQDDEFISKLGFNPKDYGYIKDFAIGVIIDDFESMKLYNKATMTEGLQKKYVIFEDNI